MNRFRLIVLLIAVSGVLAIQLPWISRPPFDAHCFRQAQTLSTIELFALEGIDLLHPKTNYVGEPGVFVLEFPIFQAFCAWLYRWFGPHVWIVHAVNLMFTFCNAALTFAIGRRLFSSEAGFAAMIIYLFAPLNLQYMSSTLIDPSAICFSLIAFLLSLRILHPRESDDPLGPTVWLIFALACTLTALIKALYLFPTCVLLAMTLLVRRKLQAKLIGTGLCLAVAGVVFGMWLSHARQVNDASYFTRNVNATVLLGFQPLGTSAFYKEMARRVGLHFMGPAGTLLALFAILSMFPMRGARRPATAFSISLLVTSALGYLIAFAKVNFPHDYYGLVASPYSCAIAGLGAVTLAQRAVGKPGWRTCFAQPAILALAVAVVSTLMFLKRPRLAPDPGLVELQQLSRGRFEPWSFAMVFTGPNPRFPTLPNLGAEQPETLYAARLRGTGIAVADGQSALAIWQEKRPHYTHLKYVVFYRVTPPPEIVKTCRETLVSDEIRQWFAYRVE